MKRTNKNTNKDIDEESWNNRLLFDGLWFWVVKFITPKTGTADGIIKFHQSDYKIRNLRADSQDTNTKLMKTCHMVSYKHNRTTTAFNFTIWPKINLEDTVEVVIQAYKFASNEYRLFPMRFQLNACKAIASNVAGLKKITSYGNFTTCCWKKDTLYYFRGFTIDDTHLPPFIPTGEYKIVFELIHSKNSLGIINGYMEIYRREV